jgi:hypothetical protein
MMFEQFAAVVREWQDRLARSRRARVPKAHCRRSASQDVPRHRADLIANGEAPSVLDVKAEPEAAPAPQRQGSAPRGCKIEAGEIGDGSGIAQPAVGELRRSWAEQLADGPKRGEEIQAAEAAAISNAR